MEGWDLGDWKSYVAKVAGIAALYYGAAKLGLQLAFAAPSVTAIWPPTGIALAAVLLWGYRVWPGVALGALLANSWTGVPAYAVLGITAGNTLEALAGAYLLREVADFRLSLDRVRDVIALVVLGGIASTIVSASAGTTSLLASGEITAHEFGSVWRTWWLGDMGGDLVVAPALLVAATHWPYRRAPGRLLEALALGIFVLAVSALAFSTGVGFTYLVFPPLIWAALRFWQPGVVGATLLAASVAIPLTEHDLGPYSGHPPDDRLLLAQTFIAVAGVTGLVLAAVLSERKQAERNIEEIAETLQEGLLPSQLPDIPGMEAVVDFHAAGNDHHVGGEFYDLFEGDDGSWAVVVGDTLGRGPTAAATTALARYTLRAAAVHEHSPSHILELLNDAILRQAPGQSCTAAYLRLELGSGVGSRLTLSIGGHPLPLVLRAAGGVEPLGQPGTALGTLPDPQLANHTDHLAPGDVLVLYTDGLTKGYAPGRVLKRAELVAVLQSCAGRSAATIASRLRGVVGSASTSEPADDRVLLVLRVPEPRAI